MDTNRNERAGELDGGNEPRLNAGTRLGKV